MKDPAKEIIESLNRVYKQQEYKSWAVIQDDLRGWDNDTGSMLTPHTFQTVGLADYYIQEKGQVKSKPRLNAVPVKIIIDL